MIKNTFKLFTSCMLFICSNIYATQAEELYAKMQASKDANNFSYYADYLANENIIPLLPRFISQYRTEVDEKKKIKLLSLITSALKPKKNVTTITPDDMPNLKLGFEFMVGQLKQEPNPTFLSETIINSLTIFPSNPENFELINGAIARFETIKGQSFPQKYFKLLSMAFANTEMQENIVPRLINESIKSKKQNMLAYELTVILNYIQPSEISPKIRKTIADFLKNSTKAGPPLFIPNGYVNVNQGSPLPMQDASKPGEKNTNWVQTVFATEDGYEQARMVLIAENDVIGQFSQDQSKSLAQKFLKMTRQQGIGQKKQTIYAAYFKIQKIFPNLDWNKIATEVYESERKNYRAG